MRFLILAIFIPFQLAAQSYKASLSLAVEKLSDTKSGQIGLWVDTGSDGSFANLVIRAYLYYH
jgi:hypothetical protein